MGLLSQPLSRGAALFAVVAVGAALSGSVPKRATSLALSQFGYLLSLAMIIGIANWTTFVFGLVAFKTLPRQTFGLLQAKLFPKYFQVCAAQCEPVVATGKTYMQQKRSICYNSSHTSHHLVRHAGLDAVLRHSSADIHKRERAKAQCAAMGPLDSAGMQCCQHDGCR